MIERGDEFLGASRNEAGRIRRQFNIWSALNVEGWLVANQPRDAYEPAPDQILGASTRRHEAARHKRLIKPHHDYAMI